MSFNLPRYKNFGGEIQDISATLANQLSQMYADIVNGLYLCIKKNVISGGDPPANSQINSYYSIGDITIRTDTDSAWIMTSRTSPTAVTWTPIT